ncbi:MAG TPA: MFS transporter [Caulobacteraceae bacterium]|nr:MFS transporter [Caulobacteraceae bacterium]
MSETTTALRLGLGTKVSYGLGSVAQGVGAVALSTTIINFYLIRVIGLRPAVVGAVIFVSLIIDAVLDPAIGRLSDTFRSPWGRRHPFMYASALPIALAICFLWRHPANLGADALAAYVLVMLIVVRLAGGLYQIPSDALVPELAPDYHARTGLISYRWFFGLLGAAVVNFLLLTVYLRKDRSHPLGQLDPKAYADFGLMAAIVVFVAILVSAMATHRYIPYLRQPPRERQTLAQSAREIMATLSNRSLLVVMVSGLVSGVAAGMAASLAAFMNFYFWGLTPQVAGYIGAFTAPAAVVGILLAPWVSRALDKKRTMLTVFFLSIFVGVVPVTLRLFGLLPPNGSPLIPLILIVDGFVAGALGLMGFVIIGSMIADVAEDAAVKTGVRSEGLLFATNGLLPKISNGAGALVGNLLLETVRIPVGAAPGAVDVINPEVMRHLVLLSLPVGMVLNLVATGVLVFYRIDRGAHEANLEALRLASSVTEPPTILPAAGPANEPAPVSPAV